MAEVKDKAPLGTFLSVVVDELLTAAERVEGKHPGVRVLLRQDIDLRVALRPQVNAKGELVGVLADVDEPAEKFTTIPLRIVRPGEM